MPTAHTITIRMRFTRYRFVNVCGDKSHTIESLVRRSLQIKTVLISDDRYGNRNSVCTGHRIQWHRSRLFGLIKLAVSGQSHYREYFKALTM